MSSSGQRFRRRAMRRGYKIDEVDDFLDRVEATLNGAPIGAPVKSQDVHDVVFRVRFGGYDEWQVDLHLDRVERQLAELDERVPVPGRGAELRASMGGPPGQDRGAPPPLPTRAPVPPAGTPAGPPPGQGPRYDQPRFDETYAGAPQGQGAPAGFDGFDPGRHGRPDMTTEIRLDRRSEPPRGEQYGPPPAAFNAPPPPPRNEPPRNEPPRDFHGRGYDDDATGTFGAVPPQQGGFGGPPAAPVPQPGYAAPAGAPTGDLQRVDQLRRTFQLRRFGSGYDPAQVDRLFENVLAALAGRGSTSVSETDLDPSRLNLVPGGYYEAEVEQAMREVRDIIRR